MGEFQIPIVDYPLPSSIAYICIVIAVWSLLGRMYPVLRFLCKYRCQQSLLNRCGVKSWAVITGASYGIGRGFAGALAARGFNLVLIARGEDTLRRLAEELEVKHGIVTRVLPFDFSSPGSDLEGFYASLIRQMDDLDVSFLVNNVGWGGCSWYEKQDYESIARTLELNIWPALVLTRWVLSRMEKRLPQSIIVNLSSASSILPTPCTALYSATKKYLDFFSRTLSNEMSRVHVLSLRPGVVHTPLAEAADILDGGLIISSEDCAEAALEHVCTAPYSMGHWKHRLIRLASFILPEGLFAEKLKKRFRRKQGELS